MLISAAPNRRTLVEAPAEPCGFLNNWPSKTEPAFPKSPAGLRMSTYSLESMRLVERLCSRFEESHDPATQDLESVVEPLLDEVAPRDRGVLLGELLAIDAELRRRQGMSISPADYQPFLLRTDLSFTTNDARRIVDAAQASLPDVPTSERYRFLAKVGSGGNGDVWRVDDRVGQRTLAVKRLRDSHHEEAAAEARLIREALLTGRLQHPGIPPIYDHGRLDDDAAFFSMKLVEGETFERILKSRSREDNDPIRDLGIFEQVTQAVAYAHAEGVIHRDLKPQNIMVGAFGEVQVMDWAWQSPARKPPPARSARVRNRRRRSRFR